MESNVCSLMVSSFTNVCIPQGRYLCSVTRLYPTTQSIGGLTGFESEGCFVLCVSTGRFIVVPRPVKTIPEEVSGNRIKLMTDVPASLIVNNYAVAVGK